MNIFYFHGFGSSGQSTTAKKLKEIFPEDNVVSPDIPVNPKEALGFLRGLLFNMPKDDTVIVGTSMGGFFAQMMDGFYRILVNPSFHVSRRIQENLGTTQPFFTERIDGLEYMILDEELYNDFVSVEENQFENITEPEKVIAFFGTEDDTVNCKDEYLQYYKLYEDFEGGHRINNNVFYKHIVPYIKSLKEKGL